MKTKPSICSTILLFIFMLSSSALAQNRPLTATSPADSPLTDDIWISMGGIYGLNESGGPIILDNSGNLIAGGPFTIAGDVRVNHVAKWDGTRWSALGAGLSGNVHALAMLGSDVCAAGTFGRVAKWDGTSWSPLGGQFNGNVNHLAAVGNDLYAAGEFSTVDGMIVNGIARWDGADWTALKSGVEGRISSLAVSGSDLYVGGLIQSAGGVAVKGIAKWDGSNWSPVGLGAGPGEIFGEVGLIAILGNDLFATAGATTYKWDGKTWSQIGGAADALLASNGQLYILTGRGISDGMKYFGDISKWTGDGWAHIAAIEYPSHRFVGFSVSMAVSGDDIYVRGYFSSAGGRSAEHIARWNGTRWLSLGGSGASGNVHASATSDEHLYIGGAFQSAGGIVVNQVAKWNGTQWSSLQSGVNGTVDALAVMGSDLYVGGYFTQVGVTPANNIAKWNGSSWSSLGAGLDGGVYAIAVSGSDVYAGGSFETGVGGGAFSAKGIAKWDGTKWSHVGSGVQATVFALASHGSELYAGGHGGLSKWDGTKWTHLESGGGIIFSLISSGTDLYVGGQFPSIAGVAANNIAKWDGTKWSPLGGGFSVVQALAFHEGHLYAASGRQVAKWDGVKWSIIGSGTDNVVRTLSVSGNNLYAGGEFSLAGGKVSSRIAKLVLPSNRPVPPEITNQPEDVIAIAGQTAVFGVTAIGTEPLRYQWARGEDLSPIAGATSAEYSIANVQPEHSGSYLVSISNEAGRVTSASARLTVLVPPTIISSPSDQTVVLGGAVSFSVSATGTTPLSYQWIRDGQILPGATSSTYSITSARAEDAASYSVRVSNSAGTQIAGPARLAVLLAPEIIKQPITQTLRSGSDATFTVELSGTPPFTFQWQKDGVDFQGETSATLNLTAAQLADAGTYTVRVTNAAGTVVSQGAILSFLDIALYPGLTITGPVGAQYRVEYTHDMNAVDWEPLAELQLKDSSFTFSDYSAPPFPKRFYRAVLLTQ